MWLHCPGIICITAQGSGPSPMLIKFVIKTAQPIDKFNIPVLIWFVDTAQ